MGGESFTFGYHDKIKELLSIDGNILQIEVNASNILVSVALYSLTC